MTPLSPCIGAAARMWEKRMSTSRNIPYYYNRETGETQWEEPASSGDDSTRAYHLLVKHCQSRRPTSWKCAAGETIRRSPEEALALICAYREQIVASRDPFGAFQEVAARESDCSSARRGGDLGVFARGQMQPAFEEAAFGLPYDTVSAPVHTDSGVHLIWRPSR